MEKLPTIGLVVPYSTDQVPPEAVQMYPHIRFVPRGVGVQSLTPAGYDAAVDKIVPAAEELARSGVDAIMVIGTSLTFYRGAAFHDDLVDRLRIATALPVSTMSIAIVEGLRAVGARRLAVCTAYADEVNKRLEVFLTDRGFEVLSLQSFGLEGFGQAGAKTEADIIALGVEAHRQASDADGLLISCGGLHTLGVAGPLERELGIPVVSSMPAAFWSAMRLAGQSGELPGRGRLLQPLASTAAMA